MTQPILLRRSVTAGSVPAAAEFDLNTFVVNLADGLLFWRDSGGTVRRVKFTATDVDAALAALAPKANPTFSGTPAAPTAAAGTSTTQLATTAFVTAAIAGLLNSAPGALDTLKELADAIGDDANYAATIAAALAVRLRVDAAQSLSSGQQAFGRSNLAAASSGANSDITSLSGVTGSDLSAGRLGASNGGAYSRAVQVGKGADTYNGVALTADNKTWWIDNRGSVDTGLGADRFAVSRNDGLSDVFALYADRSAMFARHLTVAAGNGSNRSLSVGVDPVINPNFAGIELVANGKSWLIDHRGSVDGTAASNIDRFAISISTIGELFSIAAAGGSGGVVTAIAGGNLVPQNDLGSSVGRADRRMNTIYAGTGSINTSDADEKTSGRGFTDTELDAWGEVSARVFQFLDAIEKKRAEGKEAREHYGYMSQDVEAAWHRHDLDPGRSAMWCSDPLDAPVKKTRTVSRRKTETVTEARQSVEIRDGRAVLVLIEEAVERPVTTAMPLVDEAGRPVMREWTEIGEDGEIVERSEQLVHSLAVMEDVTEEYEEMEPTGRRRLGLRYDLCHVIEGAYQRRRADRIEARLAAIGA